MPGGARHVPRHFIQYVRRELDVGLPGASAVAAWERPACHANRDRRAVGIVGGDVIWLVSWLVRRGHRFPPSLDGRVVVDRGEGWCPDYVAELRRAGRAVFPASAASRWFPLADDSALFEGLQTVSPRGVVAPLLAGPAGARTIGHRLSIGARRLRALSRESARRLAAWERAREKPVVFVSYRWFDGVDHSNRLVAALVGAGMPVWLDLACVPRRTWDRGSGGAKEQLELGLGRVLRSVAVVVSVVTPGYGLDGWTRWEAELVGPRALRWYPDREPVEEVLDRVRERSALCSATARGG